MNPPSPPAAPDPVATAKAQSAMNKETAVAQYGLNATNQKTPYGNLNYDQIGTWADGTPRFQATQTLTPEMQNLFDINTKTQGNIANIGQTQSQKIGALLDKPIDLSNSATEARLDELGRARLDPQFARDEAALDTSLINRGIRPGSDAYNTEKTLFNQRKNDAYNQLYLTGHQTGVNDLLTERNQPINEVTALMSGSQVQQPGFTNTPTPGVAPTDYIGAVGQSLAQQNVGFNAANQRFMGLQNGLFGLGKTALGGWMMG